MAKATAHHYEHPVIAADVIIFTIHKNALQVLLIEMKRQPYVGSWAAPGGLVRPSESLDDAAARLLKEKAGLSRIYLEQVHTFGDPARDPFGRVVSTAYMALVPEDKYELTTTAEYGSVAWKPVLHLPKMAYDHKEMIRVALGKLQDEIRHTTVAESLLPPHFTLTQLQKVYEAILGRPIDKRNFRKKMLASGIITPTGKRQADVANRPAEMYSFVKK